MKKDVIYIDIEDDITAIISKVKDASAKIVALVPPKRIGVLQSAVNLKLLQKGAREVGKNLVLITNDHSLISLATGVKIPVAKNLQSRPEIASIPALQVDHEDIINGEDLPVGEIAAAAGAGAMSKGATRPTDADSISSAVDLSTKPAVGVAATKAAPKPKPKGFGVPKIPNFDTFRKKLFLIGGGVLLLIIFLYWALAVAPRATITITAKTNAVTISENLNLNPSLQNSNVEQQQFKPTVQQVKKATSSEFDATGTKDIGEKASGQVTISNSQDSGAVNVPAGTVFTPASGQRFVSTTAAAVPGAAVSGGKIVAGTATVTIQATDLGPEYNLAPQSYSIAGFGNLGASGGQMAGGTREKVTVVSTDDVAKAKEKLATQDVNAIKTELRKQFAKELLVIEESFLAEAGNPAVVPAVGEQAKRGKVTIETTYTMVALNREEVKTMLNNVLKDDVEGKPNQSVFSSGENEIKFQAFQRLDGGTYTARLATTGYIGPAINVDQLAKQAAGKRYGEIESLANQIPGVNKVDIKFSPFWVTKAPSDPKKVEIKFSVLNEAQ